MKKIKTFWDHFIKTNFVLTLQNYWGLDDWLALIILGLGILYFWVGIPDNPQQRILKIYQSIHSDMIGIGITVLILGNANQYLNFRKEKHRLISQMRNPDNGLAIEAWRKLSEKGMTKDGSLIQANFFGANLKGAEMSETNLKGAYFMEAKLEGAKLNFSNLEGGVFIGAFLENAVLVEANMRKALFFKANLSGADLSASHLEGAFLKKAILNNCSSEYVHLNNADLSEADMRDIYLTESFLVDANLRKANLEGSRFSLTNFKGADLSGAILDGVDFRFSNLDNAVLLDISYDQKTDWSNVAYTKETQWPKGFTPEDKGCILYESDKVPRYNGGGCDY